ncbi:MAG: hypothetical protein JWP31_2391, partial [Aeromicrobium sp.]|nr:hypothetical protein [Aeromicrobium sp.]
QLLDLRRPGIFALSMLSIALMLPAVLLAVFAVGPRPIGFLTSVEGRMRWRWLATVTAVAIVVYGTVLGVFLLLAEAEDASEVGAAVLDDRAVVALVLVLALTPFQAAAEEYVFRGYLMQLAGSWSRWAIIPVALSVPLFVAGHAYEGWGLVDVGIFGLTAAYLTIRTGGLEAAIAAHVANNVTLLVFESLSVFVSTDEGAGPADLAPTVISSLLMIAIVEALVRLLGIARTRPPVEQPTASVTPPVPQWSAPQWPAWPPAHPVPHPPGGWAPAPQVWQPAAAPAAPPGAPSYPGEIPPGWGP